MQVRPQGRSGFHGRAVQGDEVENAGEDDHPLVHGDAPRVLFVPFPVSANTELHLHITHTPPLPLT